MSVLFLGVTAFFLCGCGDDEVLRLAAVQEEQAPSETVPNADEMASGTEKQVPLCVYICGAVERPGVYEMPEGSRVYELVNKAGGLSGGAAADYINQAELLSDGGRVYIPTVGEIEDQSASAKLSGIQISGGAGSSPDHMGASSGKVNINTADAVSLQSINGIGASRAADIVAYREANGPFSEIEDIMKVPGIKDGLFARIRDSITVR